MKITNLKKLTISPDYNPEWSATDQAGKKIWIVWAWGRIYIYDKEDWAGSKPLLAKEVQSHPNFTFSVSDNDFQRYLEGL